MPIPKIDMNNFRQFYPAIEKTHRDRSRFSMKAHLDVYLEKLTIQSTILHSNISR